MHGLSGISLGATEAAVPALDFSRFSLSGLTFDDFIRHGAPTVIVLVVALLAWLVAGRFIRSWKRERLVSIQKMQRFTAVPTSSPYSAFEDKARHDAEKSVLARFSVMRVVLGLLLVTVGFLAILLPFLDSVPQTVLSFLIAITIAIVGVAARPLIENFISGIVLSFSRQLKIGDTILVDDEHYGTVEDINPTHTVVKLWDWRRYIVPNSTMLHKEVINYSHKDSYLWTHVTFHVTPRADLNQVERLAVEVASSCEQVADYEPPQFWIRDLPPQSVQCWVAAWAKNPEEAWRVRSYIRHEISQRLRKAGIDTQLESHQVSMKP